MPCYRHFDCRKRTRDYRRVHPMMNSSDCIIIYFINNETHKATILKRVVVCILTTSSIKVD